MTKELADGSIVIQGRTFHPVEFTTFDQDLFLMERMRHAGLDSIPAELEAGKMQKVAEEILFTAYKTGVLFEVVAGIMVEKDVPWTSDEAMLNADLFANLIDKDEKQALNGVMVGAVLSFFVTGDAPSKISPNSSSLEKPKAKARKAGARKTSTGQSGKALSVG